MAISLGGSVIRLRIFRTTYPTASPIAMPATAFRISLPLVSHSEKAPVVTATTATR